MEITEVRIKLMEGSEDRLRAFCSITFDNCFVVRDLKVIQGNHGPFVAMPSRKLTGNCQHCGSKNHLRSNYCNHCGAELKDQAILYDATGRAKLYADVAHPVNARCREMIQRRIIDELNREIELASQPGYKSRYDDDYFDEDFNAADFDTNSLLPSETDHSSSDKTTATSDSRLVQRSDPPHEMPLPHDLPPESNAGQPTIDQQHHPHDGRQASIDPGDDRDDFGKGVD